MLSFLRLIRWPNLIIVAVTQWWLGRLILYPYLDAPVLDTNHFSLLIFVTVLIAASGYLINDIFDRSIDAINKPEKTIIGQKISLRHGYRIYAALVGLGFILAIYLAWYIDDFWQVGIYPLAVFLLWKYAQSYKRQFLSGNLVIAFYCAFVPGIILYAERQPFLLLSEKSSQAAETILWVFIIYALYAFLTTVWREIIKDMEDIQGDQAQEAHTLPIRYGMSVAAKVATGFGIAVLLPALYYLIDLIGGNGMPTQIMYVGFFSVLTMIPIGLLVFRPKTKNGLHGISQWIKAVMAVGLGYLWFV